MYVPCLCLSREDQTELSDSVPQFDWTFTTNYSGSLLREGGSAGIKVGGALSVTHLNLTSCFAIEAQ